MENLFSVFHKIIVAGGAIVSSVLPLTSHAPQVVTHILPTPSVSSRDTMHRAPTIVIDKTISAMGKNVTVVLTMPRNGGTINGVISGDCQGTIDGTYTGKPGYTFDGKGQVNCTFGFLSLPADATFNGVVHPDKKTADIHYDITSGSNFSKSGDVTVDYSE